MAFFLPILLAVLTDAPQQAFTSPQSEMPEYGYGLTKSDAQSGWISLFDGQTTFGWKAAEVKNGKLLGGESTTPFEHFELKADVVTGGNISLGGEAVAVSPGAFRKIVKRKKAEPIRLGPGVEVRTLLVRPLELKSVFNGKTLAGWTVLPHPRRPKDKQTHWRVENGAIMAEGGPGALELTDTKYGDFVLQIEARTREKLVNGGVFFRAIPSDFLNGYEAQIFHACYEHDPAQPARYSTGAIDDRQLARRLVSRDEEPFVMTIIANGPHIATWVDGYQMVEWTDERRPHENPRQGQRLKPGAIQLQAHDPQTVLEFHQVKIRALK